MHDSPRIDPLHQNYQAIMLSRCSWLAEWSVFLLEWSLFTQSQDGVMKLSFHASVAHHK
jgi:hypothetical protein